MTRGHGRAGRRGLVVGLVSALLLPLTSLSAGAQPTPAAGTDTTAATTTASATDAPPAARIAAAAADAESPTPEPTTTGSSDATTTAESVEPTSAEPVPGTAPSDPTDSVAPASPAAVPSADGTGQDGTGQNGTGQNGTGQVGTEQAPESSAETDATTEPDTGTGDLTAAAVAIDPSLPASQVGLTKSTNLGDPAAVQPGDSFTYQLSANCSGLTAGCVDAEITDVLPTGLDVVEIDPSVPGRTVTYDEATRRLTVRYSESLTTPADRTGLPAGSTRNFFLTVRLPASTPLGDGATITNTGELSAANATPVTAGTDVRVTVTPVVRPVATKTWTPNSVVAESGAVTTIALGIRNASSAGTTVDRLTLTDATPATYESVDVTGLTLTGWPAGADRATLAVCTLVGRACADGEYQVGAAQTGALPLTLTPPDGVALDAVTGVRIVFTAADGAALPVDQTGGTVQVTTRLRDTVRSTGEPLRPTTAQTVTNCATPSAAAGQAPPTVGPDACAGLQIQPNLVVLTPAKTFFADANNDFSPGDGRIVVGQNSPASAVVTVTNRSAFAIRTLTVTDPDPLQPGEFDKFDATDYRVLLPTGATSATVTIACRAGVSPPPFTVTGNQDKAPSGCDGPIGSLSVTFTGVDGTGQPSIAPGSVATIGLTGRMNALVDGSDVPSPSDPGAGIGNCAAFDGSTDGDLRGSAAGAVCRTLPAENPRVDGGGTKTVSQTSVPFGQPVSFTLTVRNGGNVPLAAPGVVDPQVDAAGVPSTDAAVSPFGRLRITGVTTSRTGGFSGPVIVEVYDPQAAGWVAYPASDAVLARATGVRARTTATVALGQGFTATVTTQLREQTTAGLPLNNCAYTIGADGTVYPGLTGFCSPQFATGDPVAAASLNKFIVPGSVPRRIPGLTPPTASVRIPVANTGNVSLRRLQVVDADADFFDAVDFVRVDGVNRPPGANRTQLDVCTSAADCAAGTFVPGTPTASTPGLPSGVTADQVRGVRVTFSNSDQSTNSGYLLTPGQNLPGGGACPNASVCFSVSPRATLRSDATTPIPATLADTVTGGLESPLQPPGTLQPIPPQTASLTITDGTPKLAITKTPNSTVSPGDPAPFTLRVVNTGTAYVPDLRIVDPIPDGLVFDDTFVGDGGQPFRVVESSVPTGADPWPAPTFTPTVVGDRITGVAFAFPGYRMAPSSVIAVQIQVKLAPGVAANTRIPNTAGTSSPATGLACDGTSVVDGVFGPGTWCTASATVTSRGGAAFDARKWVAGTPALGWYNTATKAAVAVGGAGCPALTVADRTYTLYPCIALVNPGDRFDYVLKFVNAGTEPATEMRLIDRFPVEGDTGVILSQQRGTQWATRPVLASAPTVLSSTSPVAGSQVLYTDGDLCNLDLYLGQRGCPGGDWDAGFGPDATAFQLRLAFANPTLPPAAEVLIGFSMTTPLDVPQVSNPTIAWNSFAHAERTVRGSGTFVLPPTEPLQVGVATAYGRLELAKAIGDNPFGLAVSTLPFTLNYSCTLTPVGGAAQVVAAGSASVTATTPVAVDGIPAGASCSVWESGGPGVPRSPGGSADSPIVVPITWDPANPAAVSRATVTNDFPARTVVVAKQVTGAAAALVGTGPFVLDLACSYPDGSTADFPLTITGAGTRSVPVPVDAQCELSERDGAGATSVTLDPADGRVSTSGSDPVTVTATNDFPNGTLRLLKSLSGPGADQADRPFTFAVDCSFQGRPSVFTQTVTLTRPTGSTADVLSADVTGIPAGAVCSVTETDSGGADVTPAPVGGVVIRPDGAAGSPVTVSFDNPFSVGSLSLVKTVAGAAADQPWAAGPFTVQVTCQRTGTGPDGSPATVTVPLPNGGRFVVAAGSTTPVSQTLPIGTRCWATEPDPAGASSVDIDHGSPETAVEVVLPAENSTGDADPVVPPISITVTNTFAVGPLLVTKVLRGDGAGFAAATPFTVAVSCTLPTATGQITRPVRTVSFTGAGSARLDGLPVGARCAVDETVTGGATTVGTDHGPDNPVTIVEESSADSAPILAVATVTNTFAAGLLAVSKTVRNGAAGPYAITVSCTTAAGATVALPDLAANLLISGGQTVTLAVPAGATCRVAEPNPPANDTVSYADSDGSTDGTVTVPAVVGSLTGATPTATVAITNTFPQNQGGGGGTNGDGNNGSGTGGGGSSGGGSSGGGSSGGSSSGGGVVVAPLAVTGVDVAGLLSAAAGLLLVGAVGLWLGRRRPRHPRS